MLGEDDRETHLCSVTRGWDKFSFNVVMDVSFIRVLFRTLLIDVFFFRARLSANAGSEHLSEFSRTERRMIAYCSVMSIECTRRRGSTRGVVSEGKKFVDA